MKGQWIIYTAVVISIAGQVSCSSGKEKVEHPQGDEAWELAHSQVFDEGEVVARVDGQVITRADVEVSWKDRPESTAREVVEELVERELLAARAREEGYLERPEVAFARKQGMVSALLRERVEERVEIDESKADGFPERIHQQRRVPRGIRASHLVILVPREVEGDEKEILWQRAEEAIALAAELLREETDDDALRAAAEELNAEHLADGLEAVVNEHMRFPRAGERFRPDQLPEGWTQVVRPFAEGAESVAADEKRGQLSEPVRTQFGWHLIRVEEVFEERGVDPEAKEHFIADQLLLDAQISRLQEELKAWGEGVRVETYPDRLERTFGGEF